MTITYANKDSSEQTVYLETPETPPENMILMESERPLEGDWIASSDGKWVVPPEPTEEDKYKILKSQRDSYLNNTDWIVSRYNDQKLLVNQPNSLTVEQFMELLEWRESLRNLPDVYQTSDDWVWTPTPEWLAPSLDNYPSEQD